MTVTITSEKLEELRERATSSLSSRPRPFLRWAGSKRGLLNHLVPHLPKSYNTYHEPFLGSGALFFLLQPERARLNDSCSELIDTYAQIKVNGQEVARLAQSHDMTKEVFYKVREGRSEEPIRRAAELLFLNRACFNGLYRVNAAGKFNVPWGAPKTSFVVDAENVTACQEALSPKAVRLTCLDFEVALKPCRRGDLVFLDPPYVTKHNNNGFIDYNERLFSWSDQARLAKVAERLRKRGCHVIVTNAFHDDVVALYPNFSITKLSRRSTLASAKERRGEVSEAIFVGLEASP